MGLTAALAGPLLPALLVAAAVGLLVSAGPGQGRLAGLGLDGAPAVRRDRELPVPGPYALAAIAAVVAALLDGPVLAVLAAVGTVAGQRAVGRRRRARAASAERGAAVEACAALATELRSGRTPAAALAVAAELATGPSAALLAAAASAAELGGDVPAALRAGPDRGGGTAGGPEPPTAVPELLAGLAACWQVSHRTGSGLATAVERLEQGLRAQAALAREVAAELAGPRASAGLLAVLPVAGLLLAAGLGADPAGLLLRTPLGVVCLVLGLALDAAGLWWTGRLVARAGAP